MTSPLTTTVFFRRFPPECGVAATPGWLAWLDRQRQRAVLAGLDDRLLADIGLSSMDARRETLRWD